MGNIANYLHLVLTNLCCLLLQTHLRQSLSLSLSLSARSNSSPGKQPKMWRLVVLSVTWTAHVVVAPITKPYSEWLCNYCALGNADNIIFSIVG